MQTWRLPIELTPKPGKQSFHFRSTEQEVLRRVLDAYGIRMVDDGSLASVTVRFDADDVDFAQAAHLLNLVTHSFIVPLDPIRVLVAKESKENHEKYDRMSLETLYLPGLTPTEFSDMNNLAKNVLGVTQVTVQPARGTLTVRAPAANARGAQSNIFRSAGRQERSAAGRKDLRGGEHQDLADRCAAAANDQCF